MYSRRLEGRTLTLGHEGILYKNSFVMYDKETGSLWVHTTGKAVRGPLQGKQLQFLPSTITTWKQWKSQHPETLVLPGRRAEGMMGRFDLKGDPRRYGLSVGEGTNVKLYPFELLPRDGVVNDDIRGLAVLVVVDGSTGMGVAFERGDLEFKAHNGEMIDQTGRSWDRLQGTSAERQLKRLPTTPWLIDRWYAFFRPNEGQRSSPTAPSGMPANGPPQSIAPPSIAPPSLSSPPYAQHPTGRSGTTPGAPYPPYGRPQQPGFSPDRPRPYLRQPAMLPPRTQNPPPFPPPYLQPLGSSLGR